MSEQIQHLESLVEFYKNEEARKGKHLEGKLLIQEAFQQEEALEDIYTNVLDVVLGLTGYSSGFIHLLNPEGTQLYLAVSKNVPQKYQTYFEIENMHNAYLMPLLNGDPYIIDDKDLPDFDLIINDVPDALFDKTILQKNSVRIPLMANNKLVGVLTLFNIKGTEGQLDAELDWLKAIGRQLGILIDHVQKSEQLQNEAILKERERLSQELHDNLSQSVSTIRLLSERIMNKSDDGEIKSIKKDIEIIEMVAEDTYASIREEMVGLRMIDETNKDIVSLTKEYVINFERQWNITVELQTINFTDNTHITPIVTIQLSRIIQEALSNVRRHAKATHVNISLEISGNRLITKVKDNGIGFDPETISEDRLGMKIMRERAESLGGKLEIISAPALGSLIEIELPVVI
jgi:two-component system nitrate/nitrite sensor histidine kinase NarX